MRGLLRATVHEAREHNERLVLATIYDGGQISRAEVARTTGLTRTTVSDVVDGLQRAGLVATIGRGPSTGGKAPILLSVPDRARLLVGVDLGDRVFSAAVVTLRGEIIHRVALPAEQTDGEDSVRLALDVIGKVVSAANGPLLGIGIAAPGLIDTTDGTVIQGVTRSWRQLPLGSLVADRFSLPVYVANDSQAAALGEHVFGSVRALNLVVIKVGVGISAGLILNGQLFGGDGFGAGEIGHTVMDPSAERCRCGRWGCLETFASTGAILARSSELLGRPITFDEAVAEFERGNSVVRSVVHDAATVLGVAVGGLIGLLHVRRIVLAGPMAVFGDPWLGAVQTAARARALGVLADDTVFTISKMDDLVMLGASALLMTHELGLQLRPSM
jgi:N-acetylglucosamine repressor